MNRIKFIIVYVIFITGYLPLVAQSDYDLRLTLDTVDCNNNTACFNVQLRSADGATWGLAGQNYRLFYDASLASWQSGLSVLSSDYQNFTLIQDIQDADASATNSNLNFEENLSFLNYTMDLSNTSMGGINLPADGSWVTTSQLCFILTDSLIDNPSTCLEIVWAKDGLTNDYATSFVEVSEWVEADSTEMADGQIYDGLDASDGSSSCFTDICNPPGEYGIRLTFDSLDCINQTACFNVQLRNEDTTAWGLAGQNYRLYYDASLASWQSGVSVLPNTYQNFTLIQDLQDVDASATNSNLAFEGTLGFLNYTMDLTDLSNGGDSLPADGSWVTTSQLCFTLEDSLLDNPSTCLEAIWARDTLTADYATSFVEVAQWVQADSTQMADGVFYDDLDSLDGNDACFNNLCLFDYGDLPDIANGTTGITDYETYDSTGGPAHQIIVGLFLGDTVDVDTDGLPDSLAIGDDAKDGYDDEDGITIFPSLNIVPGGTIRLPLNVTNLTGDTAYVEAWIDWNGDGAFDGTNEMVADFKDNKDGVFPSYIEISVPVDAVIDSLLGFRIRLSNTDNMTPYGKVRSGEVEDYLLGIGCPQAPCLPVSISIIKQ